MFVFTRTQDQVNIKRLTSQINESFLISSAQLIGNTFLFRGPRREAVAERKSLLKGSLQRARRRLLALRAFGVDLSKLAEDNHTQELPGTDVSSSGKLHHTTEPQPTWRHQITRPFRKSFQLLAFGSEVVVTTSLLKKNDKKRPSLQQSPNKNIDSNNVGGIFCCGGGIISLSLDDMNIESATNAITKFKGNGVPNPPGFNRIQTTWAFLGAFVSLLIVTNLNEYIVLSWGKQHQAILP